LIGEAGKPIQRAASVSLAKPNSSRMLVARLLRIRIGPEHLHERAMLLEFADGLGHARVFVMAIAIDEEEIFPRAAFAGRDSIFVMFRR
jgi:hypothetical protein